VEDLLDLRERFSRTITVLDGGLATELEAQGHDLSGPLWSARLLADDPEAIAAAHRAYFEAGADIATTATYQASFEGFELAGFDAEKTAKSMRRAIIVAQNVRDIVRPDGGLVAASIGPYGAVLADGSEYRGNYGLTVEELRKFHRPRLDLLATFGADLFAVETIPCLAEVEAVCAELVGTRHPAWLSLTTRGGLTRNGEPLREAFAMADEVEEVFAVGVNCCAPEDVGIALEEARKVTTKPLIAYPNSGRTWNAQTRQWEGEPTLTMTLVSAWKRLGAKTIGGCCGVSPADIALLAETLAKSAPRRERAPRGRRERLDPFA